MKLPQKALSFAQIRAEKAQDRQRDFARLDRLETTPEQLQNENAAVKDCREFQILNVAASARYFRQHQS